MPDVAAVAAAANRLYQNDEASLEITIGLRAKAIERNPALKDNVDFTPTYDTTIMGPLEDVRALGHRILDRWNKELHGLVCGTKAEDVKQRTAVLNALNLGDAAVIGAVAGGLIALTVPPALAAPLASLIAKKFILPAKQELCVAWGEAIHDSRKERRGGKRKRRNRVGKKRPAKR